MNKYSIESLTGDAVVLKTTMPGSIVFCWAIPNGTQQEGDPKIQAALEQLGASLAKREIKEKIEEAEKVKKLIKRTTWIEIDGDE